MKSHRTTCVAIVLLWAATSEAADPRQPDGQRQPATLKLGAVCSSPNTVTVFREIRYYLGRHGMPVEFTLYSNYDALGGALRDGQVDIAWNTPLAHGKFTARAGGSQTLLMRDVDVDYRVKLLVRADANITGLNDLAGKTMVFGSHESAETFVLPIHFLRDKGVNFDAVKTLSLHNEVDARGCPCDSEEHILQALLDGRGQAGVLSLNRWTSLQKDSPKQAAKLKEIWTSPPFSHCVWTACKDFDREIGDRFTRLMLAMDKSDAATREVLELEHCNKWVRGSQDGFAALLTALHEK